MINPNIMSSLLPVLRKKDKFLKRKKQIGRGNFINKALDTLPLPELHWPGYNFLGPFTKLDKRLERGDIPINRLDSYALAHDKAYAQFKDKYNRSLADRELENQSWSRVKSSDAKFFSEKIPAYVTTNLLKLKRKLEGGTLPAIVSASVAKMKQRGRKSKRRKNTKKKKMRIGNGLSFNQIVKRAKNALASSSSLSGGEPNENYVNLTKKALTAIKKIKPLKNASMRKRLRIIPIPKTGSALPLIPILAALSKVGAIAGGVSAVANAVKDVINLKDRIFNSKSGSGIRGKKGKIMGKKIGNGLYVKPYKSGLGLFIKPPQYYFQSKN